LLAVYGRVSSRKAGNLPWHHGYQYHYHSRWVLAWPTNQRMRCEHAISIQFKGA
jgi:hypothetical protein